MATTLATAFSTWLSRTWMPQADEALPFLSSPPSGLRSSSPSGRHGGHQFEDAGGRPAGRRIRKIAETLLPRAPTATCTT